MPTATLIRFPARLRFSALHLFHIAHGRGAVVAVLFQVPLDDAQHGQTDQEHDQQQRGQGEAGAQP